MKRLFRARAELVLGLVFAVLAVVSAFWPTWIESLFEVSPDAGTGESEWWIVVLFGVAAVVAAVLARRDFRAVRGGRGPVPDGT